jgi:hypothetical protein
MVNVLKLLGPDATTIVDRSPCLSVDASSRSFTTFLNSRAKMGVGHSTEPPKSRGETPKSISFLTSVLPMTDGRSAHERRISVIDAPQL